MFALHPAQVDTDVIDYKNAEGMKLYKAATTKLPQEFNGEAAHIRMFLQALRQRVDAFGWNDLVTIPDSDGKDRNLLTEYGLVTMANVRTQALTYVNDPIRAAQNSAQMFTCLYDSLTGEARLKVSSASDEALYRIGTPPTPSAACFIKLIIMRCTVETRSTVATIRKSLSTLDSYMLSVQCDVEKFNQYVVLQKDALLARGEHSSDLLTNLFTAYEAVEDQAFHYYIVGLQDSYNDGRLNFEVDSLMETALNKYKMLVEAKKWNAPTAQDAQIVALTALIKKNASCSQRRKERAKKKDDKKKPKSKNSNEWAWKDKPPKDGESKTEEISREDVPLVPQAFCLDDSFPK